MTKEEAIEILYKMDSMTWRSGERGFEAVEMAVSALRKEQYKPTEGREIDITITYTQMQALEECLFCDKPSMSAKSIAKQWINKIRKS